MKLEKCCKKGLTVGKKSYGGGSKKVLSKWALTSTSAQFFVQTDRKAQIGYLDGLQNIYCGVSKKVSLELQRKIQQRFYLPATKPSDPECKKHFFFDLLKVGLPFCLLFLAFGFRAKNNKRRNASSLCTIMISKQNQNINENIFSSNFFLM